MSERRNCQLEDIGEADDWSVAQQKLSFAYRGAGNLAESQRLIGIAAASSTTESYPA